MTLRYNEGQNSLFHLSFENTHTGCFRLLKTKVDYVRLSILRYYTVYTLLGGRLVEQLLVIGQVLSSNVFIITTSNVCPIPWIEVKSSLSFHSQLIDLHNRLC